MRKLPTDFVQMDERIHSEKDGDKSYITKSYKFEEAVQSHFDQVLNGHTT